jgi:hypothetical protein
MVHQAGMVPAAVLGDTYQRGRLRRSLYRALSARSVKTPDPKVCVRDLSGGSITLRSGRPLRSFGPRAWNSSAKTRRTADLVCQGRLIDEQQRIHDFSGGIGKRNGRVFSATRRRDSTGT